MNFIKKYYETDVAELVGGSGGGTAVIDKPINIAELMAHHGTKNSSSESVAQPIQIQRTENTNTEKKEETSTVNGLTPAATANEDKISATASPESPKPTEEKVIAEEKPIAQTASPAQTWQEVLKSQQPDTVLKELGFDDQKVKFLKELEDVDPKMLTFLSKWKNKEDVTSYLKELTTDYSKMSAEEVMRHQLRQEYPRASEAALNALYKKEVVEAYNLDSEDKYLVEEGNLLLDAKADRFRDKLAENQQNFLLPKPPEAKAPEPDLQVQKAQQEYVAYKNKIENDPYSKNVFDTKQIVIGEGVDAFKFPIDPETIKNVLYDSDKWTDTQFDVVRDASGRVQSATPKIETQLLTAAFAINPKNFLNEYAQYLKSLGGKKVIEPILNARPPEGATVSNAEAQPTTAAGHMAKAGRLVSGGQ